MVDSPPPIVPTLCNIKAVFAAFYLFVEDYTIMEYITDNNFSSLLDFLFANCASTDM